MSVNKPFRIIMHWTAGSHYASDIDRQHYHSITQGDGAQVLGYLKPEANNDTSDGNYAAHTRGCNTGAIGMAVAAMRGAHERPFNPGPDPILPAQMAAFVKQVAEMAETYSIPVHRKTILTHAEVQPTLGIVQRGKWDIAWIPGMRAVADPVQVGDGLRMMIGKELEKMQRRRTAMQWLRDWLAGRVKV